jgi:hypothetical protein
MQTFLPITSLRVFKRYSTVVYNSDDLSSLFLESISSGTAVQINPQDLRTIISRTLAIGSGSTADDNIMIEALQFQLTYIMRQRQDQYTDNQAAILNLLHGILAVPIQLSAFAWYAANLSVSANNSNTGLYAIPEDLQTIAQAVYPTDRLMASDPWTVYTFIGIVSFLLLWSNSLFGFLYWQNAMVPNTSLFSEIDICSKSSYPLGGRHGPEGTRSLIDYNCALREADLANAQSTQILRGIKDKTVRVGVIEDAVTGKGSLLIAVGSTEYGDIGTMESLQGLQIGAKY